MRRAAGLRVHEPQPHHRPGARPWNRYDPTRSVKLDPSEHKRGSFKLGSIPDNWVPTDEEPPPRAVCITGPRPCAYVTCRLHLWVIASPDRPGRRGPGRRDPEPVLYAATAVCCALDVVDAFPNGLSTDAVGALLGVSDERARQIEQIALAKVRRVNAEYQLETLWPGTRLEPQTGERQ